MRNIYCWIGVIGVITDFHVGMLLETNISNNRGSSLDKRAFASAVNYHLKPIPLVILQPTSHVLIFLFHHIRTVLSLILWVLLTSTRASIWLSVRDKKNPVINCKQESYHKGNPYH